MSAAVDLPGLVAALGLPEGAAVGRRIPKKLLLDTAAPTAADKRAITDGIDELHWLAALKPGTVGIPAYHDEVREYLEIAILSIALRPEASAGRIVELVHRAIPYPVLLIAHSGAGVCLSLAHKRWSHNETGKTVLDGELLEAPLQSAGPPDLIAQFVDALSLEKQPRLSLHALYQGWMDGVIAWQASALTGRFEPSPTPTHAAARRSALRQCRDIEVRLAGLRKMAAREKQVSRQVAVNLEIQKLDNERRALLEKI